MRQVLSADLSLIDQADDAMKHGDVARAASLLDLAAQRSADAVVLLRLATVRRMLGDFHGAAAAAMAGLELAPRNFLMGLMLGSLREATGAIHGALRAYRAALAFAPERVPFQPGIEAQLQHARDCIAAEDDWYARLIEWDHTALKDKVSVAALKRLRGLRANLLDHLDSTSMTSPKLTMPGLPVRTYFDPAEFRGVEQIAAMTGAIRDEFRALVANKAADLAGRMAGLHAGDAASLSSGQWSMIPLIRNGKAVAQFADLCPATMAAVGALEMPDLGMISPSVYFSTLEPGAHIPAHTGLTNVRAIAHLPLIVPDGCRFEVDGEARDWRVGEPLIFDDMAMHEAWNDGDGLRAVLIVDLWRPELEPGERAAIEELLRLDVPER